MGKAKALAWVLTPSIFFFSAASFANDYQSATTPASIVPVPENDSEWMNKHKTILARVHLGTSDIAFFGDSITAGMNVDLMHKLISPNASNFGIRGDRTQQLLWRLRNGELDFPKPGPKIIVVLIGTNNILPWKNIPASTNHDIFLGIQAVVKEIKSRAPASKVLLLGLLPRDKKPQTSTRNHVSDINRMIRTLADNKQIWFADIGDKFLEPNGTISNKVMSDFLHPTMDEGYSRLFTAIKPRLLEILQK